MKKLKMKLNSLVGLLAGATILVSCSSGSPEKAVAHYFDQLVFESLNSAITDREAITAMYCNYGERLESGSRDAKDAGLRATTHLSKSYEIKNSVISDDNSKAIVRVKRAKLSNRKSSTTFNQDIYLSNVDGDWLIELDGDDTKEFRALESKLYEVIEAEEKEAFEKMPVEEFETFIKKFATDYKFQLTRITFPVGHFVQYIEDGSEDKTPINKRDWNEMRFSESILSAQHTEKDGSHTYEWSSDGGMAGGKAVFKLKDKSWMLVEYTSWSL